MTGAAANSPWRRLRTENGVALVAAMFVAVLTLALGTGLVLATSAETMVVGNYTRRAESAYAADAGISRVLADFATLADWNQALSGVVTSSFVDGPPSGTRTAGGVVVDLTRVQNEMNCGKATACTDADMDEVTADRPWGWNNPRWRLYAYGKLGSLMFDDDRRSDYYIVVLVADDQSENDGDPLHDGASDSNPGAGIAVLRSEAFGPRGAHGVVEATVARVTAAGGRPGYTGEGSLRVLSWREVR